MSLRGKFVCGLLLGLGILWPATLLAQTPDQRFVAGLRERRLFDLAETFCRQRLSQTDIRPGEQADLVLQLVQTQVARAAGSAPEQQPATWEAARRTLDEFLRQNEKHPRREVLVVQHALTLLARGQSLRQEWELDASRPELKAQAAQTLRDAVAELDAADKWIVKLLPQRQQNGSEEQLSNPQLMALQNNVQFQLAQCYLNSALLYGDGEKSARVDALTQIEERLELLRRRVQPSDPLAWQILVLQMECQRRLGNVSTAESLSASLDEKSLPAQIRPDIWNERLQLALAQGKTDEAIGWLPQVASFYARSPKLCLSLVELFLTMAAKSKDESDRQTWQERADQTIRVLETYHGTYWARRANLLLLENADATHRSSSGELIARLADELIRKRQPEEALRILDLASSQASADGRAAAAAQLAIRAAQIQQQRGQFQDASDRFRLVAAGFRDQPEANEAHLSACWNLAQLVPQQPELLQNYMQILGEHLTSFPNDATADQAAIWLVPLLNRQGRWFESLQIAAGIRTASPDFAKGVELGSSAAMAELTRVANAEPDQRTARAHEVDQILAAWIAKAETGPTTDNGAAVGQLKLTKTIIALAYLGSDPIAAGGELEKLWQGSAELSAAWRPEARAWQALCRGAAGESVPESERGELSLTTSANWLSVAESMRDEKNRKPLGQLVAFQFSQLAAELKTVGGSEWIRWQLAEAESLWDQGECEASVERFSKLAAENARLLDVQIRFARKLAGDASGAWADQAIAQWRVVGAGSPPRSEAWFAAKFELARLLLQQDKLDEAEKILRYLKTVPPGWDQSSLKNDFEQLLAEITTRQEKKQMP